MASFCFVKFLILICRDVTSNNTNIPQKNWFDVVFDAMIVSLTEAGRLIEALFAGNG